MYNKKQIMDDLTILIPTYNTKNKIYRTIENIIDKFNIIIVDDGSKEETKEILRKIEKDCKNKNKLKIYFNEKNQGLAENRNILIKHVKTRYFTFLDAGDVLIPSNIIKIMQEKNASNEKEFDLILADHIDINEEIYLENNEEEYLKTLNKKERINFIGTGAEQFCKSVTNKKMIDPAWGIIYRTDFFKNNNFKYLKGHVHEDFGLTAYIMLKANKVLSRSNPIYIYIREEDSITGDKSSEKTFFNALDALENAKQLIKNVENLKKNDSIDIKTFNIFQSYIAVSLVTRIKMVDLKYRDQYIKKLNDMQIENYYLRNLKGMLKKILYIIKYK